LIAKVSKYVKATITGRNRAANIVSPAGSLIFFCLASWLILRARIVDDARVVIKQQQQQQHDEHVGVATVALLRSLSNCVICLFIRNAYGLVKV
jgi:cytochrome b